MIYVGKVNEEEVPGVGVRVCRPTALGNPFHIGPHGDRATVIAKFRKWFEPQTEWTTNTNAAFNRLVAKAREGDVTLLCWCRRTDETTPACHADVIAEFVAAALKGEATNGEDACTCTDCGEDTCCTLPGECDRHGDMWNTECPEHGVEDNNGNVF